MGGGGVELLKLAGGNVGRGTSEPGGAVTGPSRPLQTPHMGYYVSGRMVVRVDDGTEKKIGPGDVLVILRVTTPG